MKATSKILSIMLILTMVITMSSAAFAGTNDGSITIVNALPGKTYTVYKIFDATFDDAGHVSYTYDGELETNNFFDQDENGTVTLKDSVTELTEEAITFLAGLATDATKVDEATATASTLTFSNLPYGYYYIATDNGSVVTIDTTMPDVKVIDKNDIPSWDNEPGTGDDTGEDTNPGKVIVKADGTKVIENSVNYGDTVNFSIAVNAVSYIVNEDNEAELMAYYYITDTLASGFGAAQNIVVKVYEVGTDGNYSETGKTLSTTKNEYILKTDGNTFDIIVPFGEQYGTKAKIEVTYSATVNAQGLNVVIGPDGNLNTANYTYSAIPVDPDDPDIETDPFIEDSEDPTKEVPNTDYPSYNDPNNPDDPDNDPDIPAEPYDEDNKKTTKTYVYAVAVEKVDEDETPLAGATFSLKLGDTVITAVATDVAGEYKYSTASSAVSVFATDDNGYLIIKGIKEGSYDVTEVNPPEGYNKLQGSKSISTAIIGTTTTVSVTTYDYDAEGNLTKTETSDTKNDENFENVPAYALQVINKSGAELPATGGIGTTIFYVVGSLMILGAAVLLMTRKRMGTHN